MNDADPLESARYALARGKHHIADFEGQSKLFLNSHPYAPGQDIDPKTGENVVKMRFTKPFPVMLNGIASDAIINLRNALDQCGYAVSVAAGGRGKNTHFPFHDDAAGVLGAKRGGSAEIPDEIFSLMASFKPYRGGNDLLWCLNKLCNSNKHRITSPMAVATANGKIGAKFTGQKLTVANDLVWNRAKNEIEIARWRGKGRLEYDIEMTAYISFTQVHPMLVQPAEAVLYRLASEVERILMAVEAEARRIGLFE